MSSYNHPGCSCCGGPFNGGNCPSCSSVGSRNEFVYDPNPYSYNETPSFFNQPPQHQYETYSCEFCGNDAHYGYDCPPRVLSPSTFPIPVEDSDSFFKKSDTSLSYLDNYLPEFKTFGDHTEKTSSGSTTTHADNSLPEYDSFLFETEPDKGELTSVVMKDILGAR
ncbi:hypothetical protein Tco_1467002 [Tanacetum coccineum]